MKIIHLTVLLLTHILFLIMLSGCHLTKRAEDNKQMEAITESQQACINYIITSDSSLGTIRNNASRYTTLSQSIVQYVEAMNDLDFQQCPSQFTQAFTHHKNAWKAMLSITNEYPKLRGEIHELFDKIEVSADAQEFKPLLKSIWDTWAEVELAMNRNTVDKQ